MLSRRTRVARALVGVLMATSVVLTTPQPALSGTGCDGSDSVRFRVLSGSGEVMAGPTTVVNDHRLHPNTRYLADGVKIRFTFKRVAYTVYPGAFFELKCWSSHGSGNYPSVYLRSGKTMGVSTSDSPAQGVLTSEAAVHGPRGQANKYVVTRVLRREDSLSEGTTTMRVLRGRPMTLSPKVGTEVPAQCTSGSSLTINWRGEIS